MPTGEKNPWDKYFNYETKKFKELCLVQEIPQNVERSIHKSQLDYAFQTLQRQAEVQSSSQTWSSFSFPFEWWRRIRGEMFLPIHIEVSADVRGQKFEGYSLETPKYKLLVEEKVFYRFTMRLGEAPIQNLNWSIGMENPADLSKFDAIKVTFPRPELSTGSREPDWISMVKFGSDDSTIEGILKGFMMNVEAYVGIFIDDSELGDYVLAFQNRMKHRWGFIK